MSAGSSEAERRAFRLGVRQHRAAIDFVTAIEDEMRRRNVRPSALAETLDKSRAWISKVLTKKRNLTLFTAVEIADALGMDVRVELVSRGEATRKRATS